MVAIKIQSLNDIIEAYCRSLGYDGKNLEYAVAAINKYYLNDIDPADAVTSLDNILLGRIQEYFVDTEMEDFQKAAVFKVVFLSVGGAEKWGAVLFEKEALPSELCQQLKECQLEPVPGVKISCMQVQKVDIPTFSGFFNRFVRLFHKG